MLEDLHPRHLGQEDPEKNQSELFQMLGQEDPRQNISFILSKHSPTL